MDKVSWGKGSWFALAAAVLIAVGDYVANNDFSWSGTLGVALIASSLFIGKSLQAKSNTQAASMEKFSNLKG